jgi:hypothetical protein
MVDNASCKEKGNQEGETRRGVPCCSIVTGEFFQMGVTELVSRLLLLDVGCYKYKQALNRAVEMGGKTKSNESINKQDTNSFFDLNRAKSLGKEIEVEV